MAWSGGAGLALAATTSAWAATDAELSAVFGTSNVLRLKIEVAKDGLRALRAYQWEGDASKLERPVVQATVREGDRVYTNVAVQLKGGTGSFRPVDDNPSFTLNFDRFAKGQKFHGLGKISLNNAAQDPSFLSENIGRELFLAAGVPVPVTDLLAKPGRALEFSAQGWARIEHWTTRTNSGAPKLMRITQSAGHRVFHVQAGAAGVTTSWRADCIIDRAFCSDVFQL